MSTAQVTFRIGLELLFACVIHLRQSPKLPVSSIGLQEAQNIAQTFCSQLHLKPRRVQVSSIVW